MHRPSPPQGSRRLREALKSCSQRHIIIIYSMPRTYWAIQPRRKLDHPNRSCRRLHGLGVAHRCTQSQERFYARASVTPKRVLRSLRTQKSAHNGTSNSARNPGCATDRSPIKMRNISSSQPKHEPEAACPYTQPQKSSALVIWSRPKTRPGICSQS